MKSLSEYPKELIENRDSIEATFIFCLWKQPDLYDDYSKLNENGDNTIKTEDGIFYFSLGKQLYKEGFRSFDNVSIYTFLNDKPTIKKHFDELTGYKSVEELMSLVDVENIDAYFDNIVKYNILLILYDKGFNIIQNICKLKKMNSQEIYDYYDYQLNDISLKSNQATNIEDLVITEKFLNECDKGNEMGIGYSKICRILNYLTLGLPLGELFMLAGHSGTGKTSFAFNNFILPVNEQKVKCAIISNEQRSKDFKILLLVHILTEDLNYYGLTRKKIKTGKFTDEQWNMLNQAKKISKEKYENIRFSKIYDSDMSKVKKTIKKLSKIGYQVFLFDTMKSEDKVDEVMWQQLLLQSRKLFQLASKENISIITTYQLAPAMLNKRFLDVTCLSNAKQIKEVYSEMCYLRPIWEDEYNGKKYDIKPYELKRDSSGKYINIKQFITLDKSKKYIIVFLDKTRNDDDKQCVLYEFNGRFNKWKEIGYCTVINHHEF